MTDQQLELMRSLTAAQAALWDVIDEPDRLDMLQMFGVVMAEAARQTRELLGDGPRNGTTTGRH